MDQKIKNFDRGIEQMMNEHEVAPPFGMWNRISAELEAMPVAAAAAPAATSLIPKRALVGIIAAALITGTAIVTGYTVNSTLKHNTATESNKVVNTQITATPKPVEPHQTIAAVTNETKPVAKVKHHTTHVNKVLETAQNVKPAINTQAVVATNPEPAANTLILDNSNTDVPTPLEPVAKNADNQTYYFPPIDVTTPEKKTVSETPVVAKSPAKVAANTDNDDSKATSSGPRIKWPHKNHRSFGYGIINRTK